MKLQRQVIVIVGADRKGFYIGPTLHGRGYQCVHVRMGPIAAEPASACPDWCSREFQLTSHDDAAILELVSQLKPYRIKAIVVAGDSGVIPANKLAQFFDVPCNPAGSSHLHRHKYHMVEALRLNGVPCAAQFHSHDLDAILKWYETSGFRRVVMKPALGAYSDGVGICESKAEIAAIFERNIGRLNVVGELKDEYVVQEYLEGRHFVVNTVSVEGRHFVTDIWHEVNHQRGTQIIDEYANSVRRDAPEFPVLSAYVHDVLDALQIHNGPAHTEVMLTANGPRLIETGARLAGGIDYSVVEECNGYSQISVLADSVVAPYLFDARQSACVKAPARHARFIYMNSQFAGTVASQPDLACFLSVPGLMSIKLTFGKGARLERTGQTFGHPGYAMLVADSPQQLARDYAHFRAIETRFFHEATKPDADAQWEHAA
ncbi:ATP-grasp domain-containing protein [Caballeronia sp. LZ065]|uniref:ATP-grasp domain-containing protein n=1 Tax=Caballeronia sp. LZ065 TaxID=3038571 RepID=UPI00285C8FC9|nr:ATP-grasp domain-containing protein [Caballeronia sp. LZ065]MDR5781632.1 ATP-grasp domain-containing protein [Caballeronia sp. LZ065]